MRRETPLGKEEEKTIEVEKEVKSIGQSRITNYMYPFNNPIYLNYPKDLVQMVQWQLLSIQELYPDLKGELVDQIINLIMEHSVKQDGSLDGIYGWATAKAVYLVQDAILKRKATGLLDEETLQALDLYKEPYISLLRNSTNSVLSQLQGLPATPPATIPTITKSNIEEWMKKYGIWVGLGLVALVGVSLLLNTRREYETKTI